VCVVQANTAATANFTAATNTQNVTIAKATPTVTWNNPTAITYGTALSGTQLNATANTPGAFVYTPAAGTVLNAANGQTLSVNFTPTDTANYNTPAAKTVLIDVAKATPTVTWANPTAITYGTALSGTQMNATASVAGAFVYTPAAGTVLNAGNGQTLSVSFTPTDTANYNTPGAPTTVTINVAKANQTITITNGPGTKTFPSPPFTLTATGGGSAQPVTFTTTTPTVCTAGGTNGATITFLATGVCTVKADQTGDANYNPAPQVTETITVN
jgi:hypothetical protein